MIDNIYLGSNGKCYGSIAEMEKDTGVKHKYYSYVNFPMERVPERLFLSIAYITTSQFDSSLPDKDGIKLSVVNQFGEKPNTVGIKNVYVYVNNFCVQAILFHLQNNSDVFKDITLYTNWGKKFKDGDKIHIGYDLADGTKMCTGIANYITPQNHISQSIVSNYSGVPYAYNGLIARSGCWVTSWPTNPSGGIWWDGKCGVPGHGKHSSDVIKEIPQTGPKKCDCKMSVLWSQGCQCKGI